MAIIITGTPGTGKTTFAQQLGGELDFPVVNITKLLQERGLDDEWDEKRKCFLVDIEELTHLLSEIIVHNPEVIIEGHLSQYLSPENVEHCFVMKCSLPILKKRLEERGYDEKKIRENLDCEIFDVCFTESFEQGHDPEVRWSSEE